MDGYIQKSDPPPIVLMAKSTDGKFWLAALILPPLGFGIGIFFATVAPRNQNDWLGLLPVVLVFGIGLGGAIFGLIAAAISIVRRENHAGLTIITGLPCLIFVCWAAVGYLKAQESEKRQAIMNAEHYRKQKQEQALIARFEEELRANPSLITTDDYWTNKGADKLLAQFALGGLLQDEQFSPSAEIKQYVVSHFPTEIHGLFRNNRFTKAELETLVANPIVDSRIRKSAKEWLESKQFSERE